MILKISMGKWKRTARRRNKEKIHSQWTTGCICHALALELYKSYLIIGDAWINQKAYIEEKRMIDAVNAKMLILNSYIADMAKYTSSIEAAKGIGLLWQHSGSTCKRQQEISIHVIKGGESLPVSERLWIGYPHQNYHDMQQNQAWVHAPRSL